MSKPTYAVHTYVPGEVCHDGLYSFYNMHLENKYGHSNRAKTMLNVVFSFPIFCYVLLSFEFYKLQKNFSRKIEAEFVLKIDLKDIEKKIQKPPQSSISMMMANF
jgi:hypothetical protein